MRIVITATDKQWNEWPATDKQVEWIRVADGEAFANNPDADAFINLKDASIFQFYALSNKPILINAVAVTLSGMNAPANVIRINGWPGFLQRNTWEVAGKIDETVIKLFEYLNKKITVIADEPGFVSARIIAMIINEAYFATGDKVSSREDIDIAMKLGTNYPFGPFEWAKTIGSENIVELLQKLYQTDDRYKPAPLLIEEATRN